MYTELEHDIDILIENIHALTRRIEAQLEREMSEQVIRAGLRRSVRSVDLHRHAA